MLQARHEAGLFSFPGQHRYRAPASQAAAALLLTMGTGTAKAAML